MRVFHHMRELEEALRDWERYQRIPEGQFLQDRDTQNMVHHAMLLSIQSAIDIATDVIAEGRLRKPFTYRETFEVLAGEGIISDSLAGELANLAGFRNVLVHIYWNLDLKQVYAILQHDLAILREFSLVMKEHIAEGSSTDL
ncbi:MAG: DUF86 domain-containing protein [Methanoculleus sp.]|jgi:uncharacterized protein YutE (UPF0331/DUF86 family)